MEDTAFEQVELVALAIIGSSQSIFDFNLIIIPFFLQTGEFSARFLLKLPVDFSNIPTYLLKVKLKKDD